MEELYEAYCVHWRLSQGAANMKRAFSLSPSTRASRESLLELGRNHRHSLQVLDRIPSPSWDKRKTSVRFAQTSSFKGRIQVFSLTWNHRLFLSFKEALVEMFLDTYFTFKG